MTARKRPRAYTDECPHGCGPRDLIQPDVIRADRLLSVCPTCGTWTILADGSVVTTIFVPQAVQAAG